jgi:predicted helicase
MMAGKAAIIKDIMGRALAADVAGDRITDLRGQYEAFKANLIHDISVADFADIYAETIAYGLFAARLHDTTLDTFSRAEALELLPKSNPFLRSLFGYIAGYDLDDRIRWVIDELCDVFRAADLHAILKDFGKFTARNDPFLHFYETFLAEYNPAKRKARGVWYTPEPVVNFIVRAVDDVLKSEFGLPDGLADTSRVTIDWDTGQTDPKSGKPVTIRKAVHRVQILDPATGTGTFLAEVIKLVAGRVKGIAPGHWSTYVEQDLIPRLHGFELLMASYAMCHMKLDMILTELGYRPSGTPPRLGVYLTNSLEEGERVEQTLPFMGLQRAIAEESKLASDIKRQHPIMCVIGNPPYSGESANKGDWIMGLMEAYKQEPGGKQRLQERNPKWINDDYVKFIRFAEHMIAKNGEGVLGFITNHGYLDNPTFRGMRWHLMNSFDRIHVIDLHGNAKKKEVCPDGSPDKNVFDIMQGVAIIIAVKRRSLPRQVKPLAEIIHGEIWGTRSKKSENLWSKKTNEICTTLISNTAPIFPFVSRNHELEKSYNTGFKLSEIFVEHTIGIVTSKDSVVISASSASLRNQIEDYGIKYDPIYVADILYRPFDCRKIYYYQPIIERARWSTMRHLKDKENVALLLKRQSKREFSYSFISNGMTESCVFESAYANNSVISLYIYPDENGLDRSIRLNFDPKIYAAIRAAAGLVGPLGAPDGSDAFRRATGEARLDEVKVFDYIYGVLHSPAYRTTYAEFLKIDFPRVPFPRDPESFRAISEHGEALRRLHLMEPAAIGDTPFPFEGEGDSVVDKPRHEQGKVWINAGQGFAGVSPIAWEFQIGGYQPAQKWLKDRKGRALSWDDVRHYQRIIKILDETHRIMQLIDLPLP